MKKWRLICNLMLCLVMICITSSCRAARQEDDQNLSHHINKAFLTNQNYGNSVKKIKKGKPNKLINETSPYLLQHAYNPVDWYPWGAEALEKARSEDKPIMLSVGYAACHWCHVMEHESFEDPETAKYMNEHFVNIKVDREERPDLDEIYMRAVQRMTGRGGWPMTVFLTPDLKPFFGGTYFPKEDKQGMSSFKRILFSVSKAWNEDRKSMEEGAADLAEFVSTEDVRTPGSQVDGWKLIESSMNRLLGIFDREWGGLGRAPKFPHPSVLELAMRCVVAGDNISKRTREECRRFIDRTLDKMAHGGIQDQIGGGFARYSVDREWIVPHFEKMLYTNALLSHNYLDGYLITGREYWANVARNTLDFVLRELRTPQGAFYSSLDADSEGEEGKFYVWTPAEVEKVLGKKEGQWFCQMMGITSRGNFEGGMSVPHLVASPEDLAKRSGLKVKDFRWRMNRLKMKLLAAREKRVRPTRDEKVLTSWNALMISSLVQGYKVLKNERYLAAAKADADFLLNKLYINGRLLRTWGKGEAKLNGYLDDYALTVRALLDLAGADLDPKWLLTAKKLADTMIKHYWDEKSGTFYYTSDDHEELLMRTRDYTDGSTPSATSVAVMDLLRLSKLTGEKSYRNKAEQVFKYYSKQIPKSPSQFSYLLCGLDFYLSPGTEIVLVTDSRSADWQDMEFVISSIYLPNSVSLLWKSDAAGRRAGVQADKLPAVDKQFSNSVASPLLVQRSAVGGKPTVYICRNYTCDRPITDIAELRKKVKQLSRGQ